MDDTFLTVAEVADRLKLNQQTVRNWIDRGELAAVRLGQRRIRVRESDLTTFIDAGTSAAAERSPTASDLVDTHGEAWTHVRQTLADANAAAVEGDRGSLIAALNALALAANELAVALSTRPAT
jgi:excisionase family DNA binding protein